MFRGGGRQHDRQVYLAFAACTAIPTRALNTLLIISRRLIIAHRECFGDSRCRAPLDRESWRAFVAARGAKISINDAACGGSLFKKLERCPIVTDRKRGRIGDGIDGTANRITIGSKADKRGGAIGCHARPSHILDDVANCDLALIGDHFKTQRRDTVAKIAKLEVFKNGISDSVISWRRGYPLSRSNQRVNCLAFTARMEPKSRLRLEIAGGAPQQVAVCPNPADTQNPPRR